MPLLVVGALFGVTFVSVRSLDEMDDDPDLTVAVTGFQWQWQFDYPDAGVQIVVAPTVEPELVLPTGTKVQFDLTSVDVIHSFWIPGFRFKRDLFPGQTQSFEVDVGDDDRDVARTAACAPSSAGSTTTRCASPCASSPRTSSGVAAGGAHAMTMPAHDDAAHRGRPANRRADDLVDIDALGRPATGRARRPAAHADRLADDDRPQGDRHRLRRHVARVPRSSAARSPASSAPSSPRPGCRSSPSRPTTACSRSTAA